MALGLTIVVCAPAVPASAQDGQLPENNSGTGQYVEPVPDAGGDRPASPGGAGGPGGGGGGGSALPPDTRADLPPGQEGRILERVATDPRSGAPADAGSAGTGRAGAGNGNGGGDSGGETSQSAVDAITSAAAGDDGPGVPLLIFALLALTLGAAAAGRALSRRS